MLKFIIASLLLLNYNYKMGKSLVTKLNNGVNMPLIGLGTWKSSKADVSFAVQIAIKHGYRHIDCASDYDNEDEVGNSLKSMIGKVIERKDIFITTKLWNTFHKPEDVSIAMQQSLDKLKCDYIDLYLMHYPTGEEKCDKDLSCLGEDELVSNVDYVQTWKAMEKLLDTKLVKSIGVSNFNIYQLNRIIKECNIVPVVNQIENHPYLTDQSLVQFCQLNSIHVTAYSPLGSLDREWASADDPHILHDAKLIDIAKSYNKTVSQLVLRFQLQRGLSVIPKSVNADHIRENIDIFDFEISSNDMEKILSLNKNWRAMDVSWIKNNKYFPFRSDYNELFN